MGSLATPAERSASKSPGPNPLAQHPPSRPRESLDGETIFAVGDEDGEWSEGEPEDDGDESKGMVRRS